MQELSEIEAAVLSCILIKPELMDKLIVGKEYFEDKKNQKVYEILKKQYDEYKTISVTGIGDNYGSLFQNSKELENFITYLTYLLDSNCMPSQFDYYQETLIKKHCNNKILLEIMKFQNRQIEQEELLESIHKIEREIIPSTEIKLSEKEIYDLISSQNELLTFRFARLTKYANIQKHDLPIIAARPGIGKSGFAANLIEDLSDRYNCILFNLEMTAKQVYRRLVAINSSVPMSFHNKPETVYQKEKILNGCKNIARKKIKVITGNQTLRTIRNRIIKESLKEHTIAFIDYIGLVSDTVKNRSPYERVTEMVKELRQISLDYDCTIFIIAQINRNSEREKDKRPKISDLKESGELEQAGTTVLMLHNEDYYRGAIKSKEDIEIIIGKNRNGEKGYINFLYDQNTQRFEEKRSY